VEINGKSIQLRRLRLGIKAKDAAAALGISQSYYSEIERGKKPVPLSREFRDTLEKIFAPAEREAGLTASLDLSTTRAKDADDVSATLRASHASLAERLRAYPVGSYMWGMELEAAIFEADLNVVSIAETAMQMSRLCTLTGIKDGQKTNFAELRALGKKAFWQSQKVFRLCQDFFPAMSEVVDATQRAVDQTAPKVAKK
jgi:transcriptional regulator with XRE-family HTH domain